MCSVVTFFVLVLILSALLIPKVLQQARENHSRSRVWAICEVNRRVGLVPFERLARASRCYWRPFRKHRDSYDFGAIMAHSGEIIRPEEVIVVDTRTADGQSKVDTLVDGRFIQQAVFFVPTEETPFALAYQKVQGREWDGRLCIDWAN